VKILAIRFARLGDVVLLLPALGTLKERFPDSELTLLTGHRCAPVAELCPAIDSVISVDRIAMRDGPAWRAMRDMAQVVRGVRRRHFDIVVDFHSFRETNLLAWLSGAPVRIGMKRHNAPYWRFCFNRPPVKEDKTLHVAEMFQKVAAAVPAAHAVVSGESFCRKTGAPAAPLGRLGLKKAERLTVTFYIAAPVPERIWPPERFAQVADYAVEKLGAAVVVITSPERIDLAGRLREACRNASELSVFADLTLPCLSAVIGSSHLLISNDTGPMHLGPAMGVPTLGLFSVGYPEHFRPTGLHDRFLRANPIEMIPVKDVIEAIDEMRQADVRAVIADPDPRR